MRSLFVALLFALALAFPPGNSRAGLDLNTDTVPAATLELIVVEADGCIYCGIFRRDVLPSYQSSEQAKEMPIRFVDVNDADATKFDLDSPIDMVPTFIVVKDRREIGRIAGYVGPENFYHSINYLLAKAP